MAVLKKLPMGIESFEEIRKDGFYYACFLKLLFFLSPQCSQCSFRIIGFEAPYSDDSFHLCFQNHRYYGTPSRGEANTLCSDCQ